MLAALGARMTNAEIAAQLCVSARTVETHVASLLRKLGAANRRELAHLWRTSAMLDDGPTPALPPTIALLADPGSYVGRSSERAQLRALWERAGEGNLLLALVLGEAGMGKSRIAAELAAEVHADGGQVRLGTCLAELGIPYEPFVQILDADAVELNDTALAARAGRSAAVLARLAPRLASRLGSAAAQSAADGPDDRADILASIREYLDRAARQAPLLVIVEDVHWATLTTREALRYLARLGGTAPALFVLTSRDSAPDLDDALASFLGELAHQPAVEMVNLSGLTKPDVARLIGATGSVRSVDEVYAATGGNPLLALAASATGGRVNSVSGMLGARFDRLAPAHQELLEVAVVIGSEFSADLVAAAAGRDLGSALEALESAADAGLVTTDPSHPLRFSFVHALFRTVRYEAMRASTRLRLHGAIAAALRPRADDHDVLPLLAHHACLAAPLGQAEEAVMLARSAGHLARRHRGYDEAGRNYQRALDLLDLVPSAVAGRLGLLLRVDRATALFEGGHPTGRRLLQAAIEEAREHADDEALANATIALTGITAGPAFGARVDRDIAAMFSEALERVPSEPSVLRARLLVGLSGHLGADDLDRARALAREGIEMARHLEDLSVVGDGLMTYRWLIFEPALSNERVAVGEELIAIGHRLDDPKFTSGGLSQLLHVHREAGDLVGAAGFQSELAALTALRPHPASQVGVINQQSTAQYLAGDLAGAETTATRLLQFGPESGIEPFDFYAPILGTIRSQQGRIGELIALLQQAVHAQPNHAGYVAALARALSRAGRFNEAADVVGRLAADGYDMPHNVNWFIGTDRLADAVALLGDRTIAATVRERLRPFAGRLVEMGAIVSRPVDQALAQLALALDDLDDAAAVASRAITASRTRHTPIFLGHELVLLATARHRAGASDHEVRPLVAEAQQIADATGAHLIHDEIARFGLAELRST